MFALRSFVYIVILFFFSSCTGFGAFSALEQGVTTREDLLSILGEPSRKSFADGNEIWIYYFKKTDYTKSATEIRKLRLEVSLKDEAVENYSLFPEKEVIKKDGKMPPFKELLDKKGRTGSTGPRERKAFRQLDINNDNKISRAEFPGPDHIFNRLDKNNNGFIDRNELPETSPMRRMR